MGKQRVITPQRLRVLRYIQAYVAKNHYPPTLTNIQRKLGYRSISSPRMHLVALRREGYITWRGYRTAVITTKGFRLLRDAKMYVAVIFSDGDAALLDVTKNNVREIYTDIMPVTFGQIECDPKMGNEYLAAIKANDEGYEIVKNCRDMDADDLRLIQAGVKRLVELVKGLYIRYLGPPIPTLPEENEPTFISESPED